MNRFDKQKVNIHYKVKKDEISANQYVVFEFFDKLTNKPITKPFVLKEIDHRFLYIHNSKFPDCKMCVSVNSGKVDLTVFYTIDKPKNTIPLKRDVKEVSKVLQNDIYELKRMKNSQSKMEKKEASSFKKVNRLDSKLINLTIFETGIILLAFFFEYVYLNNYLNKKVIF